MVGAYSEAKAGGGFAEDWDEGEDGENVQDVSGDVEEGESHYWEIGGFGGCD